MIHILKTGITESKLKDQPKCEESEHVQIYKGPSSEAHTHHSDSAVMPEELTDKNNTTSESDTTSGISLLTVINILLA